MRAETELQANRDSTLHRWDARWKLVGLGVLIGVSAALGEIPAAGLALVVASGLLLVGNLSLRLVLRRLGAVHLFLLPVFILLPLSYGGRTVDWVGWAWSIDGLHMAVLVYLRAVAIVVFSMCLLYSTRVFVLLQALQWFRLPGVLIQVALLTYRYAFVVWWELSRTRWALATRGYRAGANWRAYGTLAQVIGTMLLRSLERTERIQRSMQCRGYDGTMRSLHTFRTVGADLLKTSLCVLIAVALIGVDRGLVDTLNGG